MERDTLMMAVAVATTPSFTSGAATRLFQDVNLTGESHALYDISADGRRFVLPEPVAGAEEKPRPSTSSRTGTKSSAAASRSKSP